MATVDGRSKLGKLRKRADELSINWHEDTTEEALEASISMVEDAASEENHPNTTSTDAIAELAKAITGAIKAGNEKPGDYVDDALVSEKEIDPNDVGETKEYFALSSWYLMVAKRVGGRSVRAPYKKIIFKLDHGAAQISGNRQTVKYQSTYRTNSKAEQAWIETHPDFRVKVFLSDDRANISNEQVEKALVFGRHLNNLNALQAPDLHRMAAEENIPVSRSMSLPTLRDLLANAYAQRDIADMERRQAEIASKASRASLVQAIQS